MSEPGERGASEVGAAEPTPTFPQANVVAVRAIAAVLETTLGPTPRDTLVVTQLATRSGAEQAGVPAVDEFVVASDGARILERLPVEHPIGPVVRRIVGPERRGDTDVDGDDVADGVTSTVVLAAALLDEAEDLLDAGVHPADVVAGYRTALTTALTALDRTARPLGEFLDPRDAALDVARTAMTGNDVGGFARRWGEIAVDAADAVGVPDAETLVVRSFRNGSVADSRLVDGAVLDRNRRANDAMPVRRRDANVLVLGGQEGWGLQNRTPRVDVSVRPDSVADVGGFEHARRRRRQEVVSHLESIGTDVAVVQSGIDADYQRLLADADVLGVRGVNGLDLRQVALSTGARTVVEPTDATAGDLGEAGLVEERIVGSREHRRKNRRIVAFERCPDPGSVCALLHGVWGQPAEQATTQVRTGALAVAAARGLGHRVPGVVPGGGATGVHVARRVRAAARSDSGRSQLAITAFADAVESLVAVLARNAGRDPIDTVAALRVAHSEGQSSTGLVFPQGEVRDALDAGVLDPVATVRRRFECATSVAGLLLTIDDAIDAVGVEEPPDPGDVIYEGPAERRRDREREFDGSA